MIALAGCYDVAEADWLRWLQWANPDYITVTAASVNRHFACHMRWYPDIMGYDVQQTGIGRYRTRDEAVAEADVWAQAEELECRV